MIYHGMVVKVFILFEFPVWTRFWYLVVWGSKDCWLCFFLEMCYFQYMACVTRDYVFKQNVTLSLTPVANTLADSETSWKLKEYNIFQESASVTGSVYPSSGNNVELEISYLSKYFMKINSDYVVETNVNVVCFLTGRIDSEICINQWMLWISWQPVTGRID